ncbi:MAG: SHOCT domain-containing protein [Hyphomicrobiaceae bacterium]
MYGPYTHGWMFDGGIGMVFGILWMLMIWGIPLLLVIALLKYLFARPRGTAGGEIPAQPKTPLDILKETYARGEISRDEYLQKRADLLEK